MKRLLALVLLVFCIPLVKAYGLDFTVSSVKYTINTDGTVSISGHTFTTDRSSLTLSGTVKNGTTQYTVKSINAGAFKDLSITNLTIKGIATINGSSSNVTFNKVTKVTFGDGVQTVGNYTFNGNTVLTTVNCNSDDLTSIGTRAFEGCTSLENLTLSTNVNLGSGAFARCTKLTSVTLPSMQVGSYNIYIFQGCSIKEVTIPEGWTTVPVGMFANNPISKITLPSTLTTIKQLAFATTKTSAYTELTIPAAVTTIGEGAFATRTALAKLTFEASNNNLTISANAFAYLTTLTFAANAPTTTPSGTSLAYNTTNTSSTTGRNITNLYAYRSVAPKLATSSFTQYAYSNSNLTIPDDLLSTYENADGWLKEQPEGSEYKVFKKSVRAFELEGLRYTITSTAPDNPTVTLTSIAPSMGSSIESLTLNSPVTYQETQYTVTNIPAGTFKDVSITNLTINGIAEITKGSTTNVTFPKVSNVTFGPGVKTVGDYTFNGNTVLTTVNCTSNDLTSIGTRAFEGCTNLATLTLSDETKMSAGAFAGCAKLTSVTLPGVPSTGNYIFQGCGIKEVTIPEGWTIVPICMFANNPISKITLPSTLTTINKLAFATTKGSSDTYDQLTIPAAVTTIGEGAFASKRVLNKLTFEASEETLNIGANAFAYMTTLNFTGPTTLPTNDNIAYSTTGRSITNLYADRSVPPTLAATSFTTTAYTDAKLSIPAAYLTAYKEASGWLKLATGDYKAFNIANLSSGFVYGGVRYTISSSNTSPPQVIVSGPEPALGTSIETLTLTSPITIGGTEYTVTSIAAGAFKDFTINNLTIIGIPAIENSTLTSVPTFNRAMNVVIGDGVVHLGDYSFYGNPEMQSLTIGKDVTYIGQRLCGETNDKAAAKMKLTIPTENKVKTVGLYAFGNCAAIDGNISLPVAEKIGNYAFAFTGLTGINMPIVGEIGVRAFCGCKELVSVSYPETVKLLESAFGNCEKLTDVVLPSTAPEKNYAFVGCNIKKVNIPEGWTSVPSGMFADNPIEEITIPNTVEKIWNQAFASTKATYTSLTIPASVTGIYTGAFAGNNTLESLTFAASDAAMSIELNAFVGIESYAPSNAGNPSVTYNTEDRVIESIFVNRTVAPTLKNNTFTTNTYQTCELFPGTDLLDVYMAANGWGKAADGYSAFTRGLTCFFYNGVKYTYEATDRSKVIVSGPAGEVTETIETLTLTSPITFRGKEFTVTTITAGAFKDVPITNLTINGVATINNGTTTNITFNKVTNVTFGPGVTTVGSYAFLNNTVLKTVNCTSDDLTLIGTRTFEGCTNLTTLTLSDQVQMNDGAFFGCTKLTSVKLPSRAAKTNMFCIFQGCGLTEINIPEGWTAVPKGLFANNPISKITLPSSLTTIGNWAFASTTATYDELTIPAAVTTIGEGAFVSQKALTKLTFEASNSNLSIGANAFAYLTTLIFAGPTASPSGTNLAYSITGRSITNLYADRSVPPTLAATSFTTTAYDDAELSVPDGSVADYLAAEGWGKANATTGFKAFTNGLTCFFYNGVKYTYDVDDRSKVIVSGPAGEVTETIETLTLTSPITFRDKEYTVTKIATASFTNIPITNLNITGINEIEASTNGTNTPFNKVENAVIGEGVKLLGNYAFYNNPDMKSVTIGKDVTNIGTYVFGATDATLANSQMKLILSDDNSIETIGNYAFNYCTAVTGDIVMPKLTSVSINSFSSTGITSLKLPQIETISTQSFARNANLRTVVLGENLTSIGGRAFDSCSQLDSVSYPAATATISNSAFALCSNLKSFELPATIGTSTYIFIGCGLTKVNIPEGWTSVPAGMFAGNPIEELTISSDVTSIGVNAFASPTATYRTLTIPAAVTTINKGAFAGNNTLDTLTFEASDAAQTIAASAFAGAEIQYNLTTPNSSTITYNGEDRVISNINANRTVAPEVAVNTFTTATYENCNLDVPDEISSAYTNALGWGKSNTSGYSAFTLGLMEFTVGDLRYTFNTNRASVILIGPAQSEGASFETLNLTSPVTYKGKEYPVMSIRAGVFKDIPVTNLNITGIENVLGGTNACTFNKAENVVLGDGVTTIGAYAFYNNPDMKSLTIGKDVETIGNYAFGAVNASNANPQMKLTISEDNSIKSIGIRAFSHGAAITGPLSLPNAVTIDNYAFTGTGITSLNAPNCTKIGQQAFENCAALETVNYSDEAVLSKGVFAGCSKLASVALPNTQPATTATNIFAGCNLTDVNIPEGWEVIPTGMFANNPLARITIPATVKTISNNAFASVSATYTTLTIPSSVTAINAGAFAGNNNLMSLTFDSSESLSTIGANAFAGLNDLQTTAITLTADYNNSARTIDNINANRVQVPGVQANTYTTATYENAVIKVPEDYINSYRNAEGWGKANTATGYQAFAAWLMDFVEGGTAYTSDDDGAVTVNGFADGQETTALNLSSTFEHNGKTYTVKAIAPYSFHGKQLTAVTIPTSVETIGKGAFMNCPLASIEFVGAAVKRPTAKTATGDEDDVEEPASLTEIGDMAFASANATYTQLEIPGAVTTIGDGAFAGNNNISSLSIYAAEPMGHKTIGSNAFSGLDNTVTRAADSEPAYNEAREIAEISSYPLVPPTIQANTFTTSTYSTAHLTVPDGYYETEDHSGYADATGWSSFDKDNVTTGVDLNFLDGIYGDVYRVYDLNGTMRMKTTDRSDLKRLPAGFYIINGKKVLVK